MSALALKGDLHMVDLHESEAYVYHVPTAGNGSGLAIGRNSLSVFIAHRASRRLPISRFDTAL